MNVESTARRLCLAAGEDPDADEILAFDRYVGGNSGQGRPTKRVVQTIKRWGKYRVAAHRMCNAATLAEKQEL
jgi:hypothetical protein